MTISWMAEEFAESAKAQSRLILDNMGITINMAMLGTWPSYKLAGNLLYGTFGLERFWCRRIRPWLWPERQRAIEHAYETAGNLHRQAFVNAVLEAGQKATEDEGA